MINLLGAFPKCAYRAQNSSPYLLKKKEGVGYLFSKSLTLTGGSNPAGISRTKIDLTSSFEQTNIKLHHTPLTLF